jgi:hypothetical protein
MKIKYFTTVICFWTTFAACGNIKSKNPGNEVSTKEMDSSFSSNKGNEAALIKGCWKNLKIDANSGYPDLNFSSDSLAIFSSIADTMYRMKYWVKDNHLYLFDGKKLFKCPIVRLTDSMFYFVDSMVENAEIHYKRNSCITDNDSVVVVSPDGKNIDFSKDSKPPPPTKDELIRESKSVKKKGVVKIVKDCCTAEDSLEPKPPIVDK